MLAHVMRKQKTENTGAGAQPAAQTILKAYSPEEVGEAIGWHPESVRLAIRQGRIPAKRFGRTWRTAHADLVAIMANGIPRLNQTA